MYSEEEVRDILSDQVRRKWEHKVAQSQSVLKHQDEKPAVMWANVALETSEEYRAMLMADARWRLVWYMRVGDTSENEVEL